MSPLARAASLGRAGLVVLTAMVLVAGCTEPGPAPPEPEPAVQPETSAPAEQPAGAATADDLEQVRRLEVLVEGNRELREARRWDSPQGYAIYVLPQIVMTAEEPGRDQAYARVDGDYFVRIERLDPRADAAALRRNARAWLAGIGEAHAVEDEQIFHPFFRDAEVFLRASNDQVSANVLVMDIDGGRYRFTMHLPHRAPSEGIIPTFWAMLQSIRTLTPPLGHP